GSDLHRRLEVRAAGVAASGGPGIAELSCRGRGGPGSSQALRRGSAGRRRRVRARRGPIKEGRRAASGAGGAPGAQKEIVKPTCRSVVLVGVLVVIETNIR